MLVHRLSNKVKASCSRMASRHTALFSILCPLFRKLTSSDAYANVLTETRCKIQWPFLCGISVLQPCQRKRTLRGRLALFRVLPCPCLAVSVQSIVQSPPTTQHSEPTHSTTRRNRVSIFLLSLLSAFLLCLFSFSPLEPSPSLSSSRQLTPH